MTGLQVNINSYDALTYLIEWLKSPPNRRDGYGLNHAHDHNMYDIVACYVRDTYSMGYTEAQHQNLNTGQIEGAFLEAAWNLTRMGIIRPTIKRGKHGEVSAMAVGGYGISITELGATWLRNDHPAFMYIPADPTRFTPLIEPYQDLFGDGFFQRASEAGACWAHGTYYAACSMAGAAAESIMLAIAVQKSGDEAAVLAEYSKAGGRGVIERKITENMKPKDKQDFEAYTALLKYWRDNAAHGKAMSFTEFEAHDALSRLLRFAQFVKERWQTLTQRAANSEAA